MAIRLPDIPSLQSTRVNAAPMSGRAAAAPYQALGEVGEAFAGISKSFAGIAGHIQETENQRQLSEIRTGLDRSRTDFLVELDKDTDPASRLRRMDEFLQQQKSAIDRPDLAPVVRDKLVPYFDSWATDTRNRNAFDTAKLSEQRRNLALSNEFEAAKESGDRARLDTAISSASILPEQADKLRTDFDRHVKFRDVQSQIDQNAISLDSELNAPDAMEKFGLDREAVDSLRRQAHQKANALRNDTWDGVVTKQLEAPEGQAVLSRDDVLQMVKDGQMEPSNAANYLRTYHGPTPPQFDPVLYDTAAAAIAGYDPRQDPNQAGLAQLRQRIATLPLPKESVRTLSEQITDKLKDPEKPKHRFAADFNRQTGLAFDQGKFGTWFKLDYPEGENGKKNFAVPQQKIINAKDFAAALGRKRQFLDAWDSFLSRPEAKDLTPETAQKTYDTLFQKIVVDKTPPPDLSVPASTVPDFRSKAQQILGKPDPRTSQNEATPSTFGGQSIMPVGTYYQGARATAFGGANDPADNGRSAFGGKTGAGGREGVAIPEAILRATFPGKSDAWLAENAKVHVKTSTGATAVLPIADKGTAEWVWQRDRRPVLDLTEGAIRQLGGAPTYNQAGKLSGASGIGDVSFALTTAKAADLPPDSPWPDLWEAWFKDKRPTDPQQIESGLAALFDAHSRAAGQSYLDEEPSVLPAKGQVAIR